MVSTLLVSNEGLPNSASRLAWGVRIGPKLLPTHAQWTVPFPATRNRQNDTTFLLRPYRRHRAGGS